MHKHIYYSASILLLFLSLVCGPKLAYGKTDRNVWILVTGVSNYPNLDQGKQLPFAIQDARLVYALLDEAYSLNNGKLSLLLNPDREAFIQSFHTILTQAQSGDLIFLYFAGHGDTYPGLEEGYLLFSDVREDGDYSAIGGYSLRDIGDNLQLVSDEKDLEVVLITDACRVDHIISTDGNERTQQYLMNPWEGVCKILSCSAGEESFEGPQWGGGHGVFTYHLFNAFKGSGDKDEDGQVTIQEAFDYVYGAVKRETRDRQVPQLISTIPSTSFTTKASNRNVVFDKGELHVPLENAQTRARGFVKVDTLDFLLQCFLDALEKKLILPEKYIPNKITQNIPQYLFAVRSGDTQVSAISFAKGLEDMRIATGNFHGEVNIWDLNSGSIIYSFKPFTRAVIKQMLWDEPRNLIVVLSKSGDLALIDLSKRKVRDLSRLSQGEVSAISRGPSGHVLVGTKSGEIWIIENLKNNKRKKFASIGKKAIEQLCFLPEDNMIILIDSKGKSFKINSENKKVMTWHTKTSLPNPVSLHTSPPTLTSLGKGELVLANALEDNTYKRKIELSSPVGIGYTLTGDYLIAAGNRDETPVLRIFDLRSRSSDTTFVLDDVDGKLTYAVFDPHKNMLCVSDDLGVTHFYKMSFGLRHASEYYKMLLHSDEAGDNLEQIKGAYYLALQQLGRQIIYDFIDGIPVIPALPFFNEAIYRLDTAMALYDEGSIPYKQAKIKRNFLNGLSIVMYDQTKRFDEAQANFLDIASEVPGASFPYQALGMLHKKANDNRLAQQYLDRVVSRIVNWTEPKKELGSIYLSQEKYDDAKKEFLKIIRLRPNHPKGYMHLGYWASQTGDFPMADSLYAKAMDLAAEMIPETIAIYHLQAELAFLRKDFFTAENHWTQCLRLGEQYELVFPQARIGMAKIMREIYFMFSKEKRYLYEAIAQLDEAQSEAPYSGEVRYWKGTCYDLLEEKSEGKRDSATTNYVKAYELSPHSWLYQISYQVHLWSLNPNSAELTDLISSYIDESQNQGVGHLVYAADLLSKTNPQFAIQLIEEAIEQAPEYYPAYLKKLEVLALSSSNSSQAIVEAGQMVLRKFPKIPQPPFLLAKHFSKTGNPDQAIIFLNRSLSIDSNYIPAKLLRDKLLGTYEKEISAKYAGLPNRFEVENLKVGLIQVTDPKLGNSPKGIFETDLTPAIPFGNFLLYDFIPPNAPSSFPHIKIIEVQAGGTSKRLGAFNARTNQIIVPVIFEKISLGHYSEEPRIMCRLNKEDPQEKAYFFTSEGNHDAGKYCVPLDVVMKKMGY